MRALQPTLVLSAGLLGAGAVIFACGESLVVSNLAADDRDASSSEASSAALIDAGGDGSFCSPQPNDLFCAAFHGSQPQTGWGERSVSGDAAALSLDSVLFTSPPSSLVSTAGKDGIATLTTQVPQDSASNEGLPFSLDFDFRVGPVVNQGRARLLSINFQDTPNRLVRLFAIAQDQSVRLSLQDLVGTEHTLLPLATMNEWTHARFEARRDTTVDSGSGEPVWKISVIINNDPLPKLTYVATDAVATRAAFDVELGVDKGGLADSTLFTAHFDNVRIQRIK